MSQGKPESASGFGRREFLGAAAAAFFAGVVIQITGCDSSKGTEPVDREGAGSATGIITDNHPNPHAAVVTKVQLDAGSGFTLHIQGAAAHDHTVVLSDEDMAAIKAKGHVMKNSSEGGTDGHAHSVMFN